MNKVQVVVIVDGSSSGQYFAKRLKTRNISAVHVQSKSPMPKVLTKTFHPEDYIDNVIFSNSLDDVIRQLQKYEILAVIPGCEMGVEFADILSEVLGLASNGTVLSSARRNKFQMIEAVKKYGLKTVKHCCSDQLEDILAFAHQQKKWPIVLKPLKGASTENVIFCDNDEEIKIAFEKIMHSSTFMLDANKEVLAQSFLRGTEYVVNTVSCEGKHFISDIWVYKKRYIAGHSLVYDYIKVLPYEFEHHEVLTKYALGVLNALGIKHGPSHQEIMLTQEGPILIECGARIMGALDYNDIHEALGRDQLELTLDSYLNHEEFFKKVSKPYQIKKHILIKFIISHVSGTLQKIYGLERIKKLDSFRDASLAVAIGRPMPQTIDLLTSPGLITLMHPNQLVVQRDYEEICEIEKEMFVCRT